MREHAAVARAEAAPCLLVLPAGDGVDQDAVRDCVAARADVGEAAVLVLHHLDIGRQIVDDAPGVCVRAEQTRGVGLLRGLHAAERGVELRAAQMLHGHVERRLGKEIRVVAALEPDGQRHGLVSGGVLADRAVDVRAVAVYIHRVGVAARHGELVVPVVPAVETERRELL